MALAIEAAAENPDWPFGAVLVHAGTGGVVARGVNAAHRHPAAHAELVALDAYLGACGERGEAPAWSELSLYTTAEPCPMCLGALVWAGLPRVIWGTSIEDLDQRFGFDQIGVGAARIAAAAPFYRSELLLGGVLRERTDALFAAAAARRTPALTPGRGARPAA
jgi:tRNA(Arg) A34 adenosine deaminase TadA